MSSSVHNPAVLLKRVLNLTESSAFILCTDTLAQTSASVIEEMVYHRGNSSSSGNGDSITILVAFSTVNKPEWASHFVDVAGSGGYTRVADLVHSYLPSPQEAPRKMGKKALIIIDSLNEIPRTQLSKFIGSLASPHATIVATFHRDMPESIINQSLHHELDNYPSATDLLEFMATTVLRVNPILPDSVATTNDLNEEMDSFTIPRGLNGHVFKVTLTNRRKSGRSLTYNFHINTRTHSYDIVTRDEDEDTELETPEMLQGLTTFNLSTSDKQKEAKSQVNLPFLEAQQFGTGGAIVYDYEKDDDYDEEDPYEDPF